MTAPLAIDDLTIETPGALFDVTRLVRGRRRAFGTGVDRIDIAVARYLLERFGERCAFVHAGPFGPSLIARDAGAALIRGLSARWSDASAAPPIAPPAALWARLIVGTARRRPDPSGVTYVNSSHSGLLARKGGLAVLDPEGRMARLAYVHDLIPLEYPEYQRPHSVARFRALLGELAARPFCVATNTADTARRFTALAAAERWPMRRIEVAIPRLAAPPRAARAPRPAVAAILRDARPFFLCVGTIEPRKNHLMLLALWRDLAARIDPPRLVIAGRRGWENEMVLDMLDRCPAVAGHVSEFGDLSDTEIAALMGGARALLFPSFAEGLGLPLLEATALGARAIVSDLPAFREIAPADAVFLDPLDGAGWRRAILAAADGAAPARIAGGAGGSTG